MNVVCCCVWMRVHVCCVLRVAQQEASNCMSAQGLAIIFAPSLLRTTQLMSPIESLRDVSKQAASVLISSVLVMRYLVIVEGSNSLIVHHSVYHKMSVLLMMIYYMQ